MLSIKKKKTFLFSLQDAEEIVHRRIELIGVSQMNVVLAVRIDLKSATEKR